MTELAIPLEQRPEPERDQYGRYVFAHPETGKRQPWIRATTWAATVSDRFALEKWGNRMVSLGLARRPDLMLAVAAVTDPETRDGKRALDGYCEQAKEHAGASTRATIGSALHSFTEAHDRGRDVTVPEPYDADVAAYHRALADAHISIDTRYIEGIVCVPELDVAGTFDRIFLFTDTMRWLVADLKTGRDLSYSWTEISIQLALYAHAATIYNPVDGTHTPMPPVDQTEALVMHLPVGEAKCTLYTVDIAAGWDMAQLCGTVREWRKRRDLAVTYKPHLEQRGDWLVDHSAFNSNPAPVKPSGWVQQLTANTNPAPVPATVVPDDGAVLDITILDQLKTIARATPESTQNVVRRWIREARHANVGWFEEPIHQRQHDIALAALMCAKHLYDETAPDALTRAALAYVMDERQIEGTVGFFLGHLTTTEAGRLARLAKAFGDGDPKATRILGTHL